MNRWSIHEIGSTKNRIVGLFMIAALLFVCLSGAWKDKNTSVFMTKGETVSAGKEQDGPEEVEEKTPEKPEIAPDKPMIALTFDDGPGKYTDILLETLEENDAKATFFLLGDSVDEYPETIQKMEEIGCEIGNHTYHHANLTKLTPQEIEGEIEWTNQALVNVLGQGAGLVRPPYGAVNEVLRSNAGYPLIMWSVDTTDWQSKDAVAVTNYVLETAQDGDIILLHDIYESTVEAAKAIIPVLKERGYQLVTVSEMAEMRGVTLENGVKYFNFYQ